MAAAAREAAAKKQQAAAAAKEAAAAEQLAFKRAKAHFHLLKNICFIFNYWF